jgi:hypothetical protein
VLVACLRAVALKMMVLNMVCLYTLNTVGPLLPDHLMTEVSVSARALFSLEDSLIVNPVFQTRFFAHLPVIKTSLVFRGM